MKINIRKGVEKDIKAALGLIQELADYEKAPQEVVVTEESMLKDGFGELAVYEFLVAEIDNAVVGIAVYFPTYSTWKGRALHLEDLVVTQSHRRKGIGRLLFDTIVQVAQKTQTQRLTWQVLDWNSPAIEFYETLDANFDGEWINCKLTASQIQNYSF
ncbi:MAG: GNAT family N-acetyltransferase [Aureispira sp.]|nr:GNAT family N-acetyltransferase [Aureispira sp.]